MVRVWGRIGQTQLFEMNQGTMIRWFMKLSLPGRQNGEHAMEFEGTVREGVVVVDCSEPLPEGAKVKIFIEQSALTKQPTLAERLLRHSGTVPGLPPDIAAEHDHYIHGTPKR
jgi:hypothetical protein